MSDVKNLSIKSDVKSKLDLVKGENNETYSSIINKLLQQSGGVIVDDVITIQREQVALSLKYWDDETTKIRDITFLDLREDEVGTKYAAKEHIYTDTYVNSTAELIYQNESIVVLLVENINVKNGKRETIRNIVHVELF